MTNQRERGDLGEDIATRYLQHKGWTILGRNINFRVGELDIVALDGDTLVFVEVRSRTRPNGPPPAQTVTFPKQRRLTRAAELYRARSPHRARAARFDVIGVDLAQRSILQHIRGAFDAAPY